MVKSYAGLVRRNHTFYLRVRIPESLFIFVNKHQICYSLYTNEYREAVRKYNKEILIVRLFIEKAKEYYNMEVKGNSVVLTETEKNKVLMQRLEELIDKINDDYDDIVAGNKTYEDILLGETGKMPVYTDRPSSKPITLAEDYLKRFIISIGEKKDAPDNIKNISNRVKNGNLSVASGDVSAQEDKLIILFNKKFDRIERYAKSHIDAISKGICFNTNDPMIISLLQSVQFQKDQQLAQPISTKTRWEDVLNDNILTKNNLKACRETTINGYRMSVRAFFEIINKENVEEITENDIISFNKAVYRIPKNWALIKSDKQLKDKLLKETNNDPNKKLSALSIHKYLSNIKQFLKFAKRKRYISDDFGELFDSPERKVAIPREGFTDDDLVKIFNKNFYPNPIMRKTQERYWIPLIALYTGARLREIMQIYIDDIHIKNGIWYINITDERPTQQLKTSQSKRVVPIHPMLIKLGLDKYITEISKDKFRNKEGVLFPNLFTGKGFSKKVDKWFNRYLRDKAGITSKSKVFHSFRHTMATALNNAGVSAVDIHCLGGWTVDELGICEKTYTHPSLDLLYNDICKVEFPVINEIFGIPLEKTMGK